MMKTLGLLGMVLVLLISLVGCSDDELVKNGERLSIEKEDELRVGIVLKALDSEHWVTMKKGAEDAAKFYGIDVIVLAPDRESNVEMQFQMVEDLIVQNVDAIGIAPCDSTGVVPLIDKAHDSDIAVFTIDTNADTDVVSFIGTNNYLGGKMAAERIIEILDGRGNVVLITGVLEQQTHRDRSRGFKQGLKDSNITIIEERQANSESELAMKTMNQLIEDHVDIDAVFTTNALMALGILEAIEARQKSSNIKVIGFDVQQELLEGVKNEIVDSVIAQNPYSMGYETVKAAVNHLRNREVEGRIDTGTDLITVNNVDRYKELFGY